MVTVYRENTLSKQFENLIDRDRAEDSVRILMTYTHEVRRVVQHPVSQFQITKRPHSVLRRAEAKREYVPVGTCTDEYKHLMEKLESIEEETGRVLAILK